MKLGSKTNLCAIVAVALLLAVPLAGGLLVRTEAVQRRIREGLSLGAGMQVKCESFQPGFWSATRMTRLTASNQDGSSVYANEAYVKLELLPLLLGRLVFREIRLEGVRLICMESTNSRGAGLLGTELPKTTVQPGAAGGKTAASRRVALLKALRILSVSEAAVDWQLADGRTKLQMEGVDFRLRLNEESAGSGELTADRCTWMDVMLFKEVCTEMRLADGTLHMEAIKAACGEGSVTGSGNVALFAPQPFGLRLKAADIDLEKMSDELPSLRLSGIAQGTLQIEGSIVDEATWAGGARVEIRDGKLRGINLLQMIGQVFQIQELSNFQIKQGLASVRIAERRLWLDELKLDGGDLVLNAPGTLDFQRNLALNAKLSVPERLLSGRVAQLLSRGFSAPDQAGLRSIAFQVSGTLDKPSTNLMDKVVGEGLGGVVNQLLGGFLKPRKVEKTEQKEAPAEAPR